MLEKTAPTTPEETPDIQDRIDELIKAKARKEDTTTLYIREKTRLLVKRMKESIQTIIKTLEELEIHPEFFKEIVEKLKDYHPKRYNEINHETERTSDEKDPLTYKETTEKICTIEEELQTLEIDTETTKGKKIIDTIKIALSVRYRFLVKYKEDLDNAKKQGLGKKEIFLTVIKNKILKVLKSYKGNKIISDDNHQKIVAKLSQNEEPPVEFEISMDFPALFISVENIKNRKGETLKLIEILEKIRYKHNIKIPTLISSDRKKYELSDLRKLAEQPTNEVPHT